MTWKPMLTGSGVGYHVGRPSLLPEIGKAVWESRFMPALFEYRREVVPEEIDRLGHVNNLVYLKWMIDAALEHSAVQGWPVERHEELGAGWVVRSHFIEYLEPAMPLEKILIKTWVAAMKRVSSLRRYQIVRASDETLLARGETNWAFVDFSSGSPRRIPVEVSGAFEIRKSD